MAGFQVSIYGRFWASTEASKRANKPSKKANKKKGMTHLLYRWNSGNRKSDAVDASKRNDMILVTYGKKRHVGWVPDMPCSAIFCTGEELATLRLPPPGDCVPGGNLSKFGGCVPYLSPIT